MVKTLLVIFLMAAASGVGFGHPVPDIPVRSTFESDGTVTILVEVDPRCFAEDPLNEPYLENATLQGYSEEQKAALKEKAKKLISEFIEFRTPPDGVMNPKFEMSFTTFLSRELPWNAETPDENSEKCAEMPVMVTARWTAASPNMTGYQIKAKKAGKFTVRFINHVGEKRQRPNVLFPGEESYVLDLKEWSQAVAEGKKPDQR